jgi:hypothetical protein
VFALCMVDWGQTLEKRAAVEFESSVESPVAWAIGAFAAAFASVEETVDFLAFASALERCNSAVAMVRSSFEEEGVHLAPKYAAAKREKTLNILRHL